jgi:hypothetical protein
MHAQLTELNQQLQAACQVLVEVDQKLTQLLLCIDCASPATSRSFEKPTQADLSAERDLLSDASGMLSDPSRLAPEMQLSRLMAQLTAAYNRIALLEEQLLQQRLHPPSEAHWLRQNV